MKADLNPDSTRMQAKTELVPFAESFGRFRRIGLHQTTIAVGQIHREEVDLALPTCDQRERFTDVDLHVSGIVACGTDISHSRWRRFVHVGPYDRDPPP